VAGIAVICAALLGCDRHPGAAVKPSGAALAPAGSTIPANLGYPPGRWHFASTAELTRSIVWVSHILVMHGGSDPARVALRGDGWSPDAVPSRSREEAYQLALKLKARADADPAAFGRLAIESSDDAVTRAWGGSLGGVRAVNLPPPFLDAIAALGPGQISNVIETPMGFHILLIRSAPPAFEVSGTRIVVRYGSSSATAPSGRSRDDAMKLAASLVAEARGGADFTRMVREHSDDADRGRGGIMGTWLSREPGANNALPIEVLSRLDVGGVSDPVDSPFGIQVIRRTPPDAANEFAARTIKVPVGGTPPNMFTGNAGSTSSPPTAGDPAYEEAKRIAVALQRRPAAFAKFADLFCCRTPGRWAEGHGDPLLTSAVEKLEIGKTTTSPLTIGGFYVIVERLDPDLIEPADPPQWGLPAPARLELADVFRANSGERLAAGLAELRGVIGALRLSKPEGQLLEAGLDRLRDRISKAETPDQRSAVYAEEITKVHRGLSEASYARVISSVDAWVASRVLVPRVQ
jgi:hypothetical protein